MTKRSSLGSKRGSTASGAPDTSTGVAVLSATPFSAPPSASAGTSASAAFAAEPFRGPRIGDFTDVILVAAAEEEVASSDIRETVFMGEKETGGLHRPPLRLGRRNFTGAYLRPDIR